VTSLRKLLLACLVGGSMAASAGAAGSAATLSADIAPQPLAEALATFGRQTGLQLLYLSGIAEAQHSKGARAGLTASAALTQLLEGTGLKFEFLNARTVRIFPASVTVPTPVAPLPAPQHPSQRSALALEEVIVTATRREEAVSRVPIDMTVWTQDAMEASGVKGMADLASLTPAMQFQPAPTTAGATTYLLMRGVTGRNASTTGVYLDDTPVPPLYGDYVLYSFPFTFDLDRVEVLRGPQLQLFGEGNQGGAVRFIFNQPSLSTFTAYATSELATTSFGGPSYEAGGALGGPVILDAVGFRISAWARSDGGYVDRVDPFTQGVVERNANHSENTSLRGALTFVPSEALQITPSLTYTSYERHDQPYFWINFSDVGAGQLKNGSLLRQPANAAFYLGALKVEAALGGMHFSAVSSYFDRTAYFLGDDTEAFDWGSPLGAGYPVSYADAVADQWYFQQRMFMQELRLASSDPNATLTWDAAAFYSTYHVRWAEHLTGTNGLPKQYPAPTDLSQVTSGVQTRLAAFGEVALRMTNRLTVSAALHGERIRYDAANELAPFLSAAGADSSVMPRLRLAYQADEHQLFYVTVGKGYGSGGPVPPCFTSNQAAPEVFGMDTLWSYEVGTKSTLLDGRMRLDTGLFHVTWNNAGYLFPGPCGLPGSPGSAASNGFDLAVQWLASAHLQLDVDVAYTDASYTDTVTQGGTVIVREGQAVNASADFVSVSPWNLAASVDYLVQLGNDVTADFRAQDVFRSQNPGPFALQDPQSALYYPGYRPDPATNLVNLRASVRRGPCEAALFVNNAFNSLPTIQQFNATGVVPTERLDAATFRPRAVGLALSWRF
jgi:outer membrane receptor protein involved in Fe transport